MAIGMTLTAAGALAEPKATEPMRRQQRSNNALRRLPRQFRWHRPRHSGTPTINDAGPNQCGGGGRTHDTVHPAGEPRSACPQSKFAGLPVEVSAAVAGGAPAALITLIAVLLTNRHTTRLAYDEIRQAEERWASERASGRNAREADAIRDATTRLLDTSTEYHHALVDARSRVDEKLVGEWEGLAEEVIATRRELQALEAERSQIQEQLARLCDAQKTLPSDDVARQRQAGGRIERANRAIAEAESRRSLLGKMAYGRTGPVFAAPSASWQSAVRRSRLLA